MDLLGTKILALFLVSGVALLLGFMPWFFGPQLVRNDGLKQRTIFSVLLCFGGGVLLATSLLHILPEVKTREAKVRTYEDNINQEGLVV